MILYMLDNAKRALRQRMLQERAALSNLERERISEGIYRNLLSDKGLANSKVIFLYCSTKDEIDTDKIAEYCLLSGKTVCAPRCIGHGVMSAHEIKSLSGLVPGKYGIREPKPDSRVVSPDQIDLVLAPCLCADRRGYRLGYGCGYYDRFLEKTSATIVALCASSRLMPLIPAEGHDCRCHKIVTDTEVVVTYEK